MAYLISYDLIAPGRDYSALYDAIRGLGAWWHCLESVWIVHHSGSAVEIRDYLQRFTDANDKLFVVELASGWASQNLNQDCVSWLQANL